MSWTWQGRQLATAEKGGTTLNYTYDSEGIRTSKSDGTNTTKYLLNGTQILAQKTGSTTLSFFYDQQGNRVAMADGSNKFYYYIYNLQGDVIALADASTGKLAATYTYDAWGKIVKINGQNPDAVAESSIAKINPFRYRGYYYDTETSLYYLQSRYYDPDTGRFISADGQLNEGVLGYNMFAYCENDPVNGSDPYGDMVWWAAAALGGAASEVAFYLIGNALSGKKSTWEGAAQAALTGAIEGVAFGAIGRGVQAIGKAVGKAVKTAKAAKAAKLKKATEIAEKKALASKRASAVRQAWKNEYNNVRSGGTGISREWSSAEMNELLTTGRVKGYQGHHMKSVKGYPELAGDPTNIQFLTRSEHLAAHGGNWRNITHGRYVIYE